MLREITKRAFSKLVFYLILHIHRVFDLPQTFKATESRFRKMPKQKRNHFIGQGTIRFWSQSDGRVVLWDKAKGSEVEPRNPKSVHYRDYLYARWDTEGRRDMAAETALKLEIDDHVPQMIERLIDAWPNPLPLPSEDRILLIKHLARAVLRHPSILGTLNQSFQARIAVAFLRLSRWFAKKGDQDKAYNKFGRDRVLAGELRHMAATADIDKFVEQLSQLSIGILVVSIDGKNLALGSQPFILNPYGKEHDMRFGMVIHPRILIGLFPKAQSDFVEPLSLEDTLRINGFIVRQSDQVVLVNAADVDGAWYDVYEDGEVKERIEVAVGNSVGS